MYLLNVMLFVCLQVASYEFTTLTCIPGVIGYRGAKIQVQHWPLCIITPLSNFWVTLAILNFFLEVLAVVD